MRVLFSELQHRLPLTSRDYRTCGWCTSFRYTRNAADNASVKLTEISNTEPIKSVSSNVDQGQWSWGESNPRPPSGCRPCYDHS